MVLRDIESWGVLRFTQTASAVLLSFCSFKGCFVDLNVAPASHRQEVVERLHDGEPWREQGSFCSVQLRYQESDAFKTKIIVKS